MEIGFASRSLQRKCACEKDMQKAWGLQTARRLLQRLKELRLSTSLENMREYASARCHELKGDRTGQLALELDHPRRLILKPAHDPPPMKEDGGLDWTGVTGVVILEIVDYH